MWRSHRPVQGGVRSNTMPLSAEFPVQCLFIPINAKEYIGRKKKQNKRDLRRSLLPRLRY
jgi:hypothetical protein